MQESSYPKLLTGVVVAAIVGCVISYNVGHLPVSRLQNQISDLQTTAAADRSQVSSKENGCGWRD
jgi:hypothetical protein